MLYACKLVNIHCKAFGTSLRDDDDDDDDDVDNNNNNNSVEYRFP